ncbi:MAG: DUF6441 family protein [Geminicoccaceae bacterium]
MKLSLRVTGNLRRQLQADGLAVEDAGNAAVVRQTDQTKGEMRVQIAGRLSARAANALRSTLYRNPSVRGGQGNVASYIHSAWWRKDRKTGDNIDMFWAFEQGAVISGVKGRHLAIPLPAAYAVAGRGRKRPTPEGIAAALSIKLFALTSKRGNRFLAITPESGPVAIGRGRRGSLLPARYVKTKGDRSFPTTRRATVVRQPIPLFLLLKNVRLPKRLDFDAIVQTGEQGLDDKFQVELARRGI